MRCTTHEVIPIFVERHTFYFLNKTFFSTSAAFVSISIRASRSRNKLFCGFSSNEIKIKNGDRVRGQITVLDRAAEISISSDLASALRAEGVMEHFKSLPRGKQSYIIRCIDEAAKSQTREKRIQEAVEVAHRKRG